MNRRIQKSATMCTSHLVGLLKLWSSKLSFTDDKPSETPDFMPYIIHNIKITYEYRECDDSKMDDNDVYINDQG